MIPIVCIDGPSGAGKGTVCRLVSDETGYALLDSGALYRITALAGTQANVDLDNESLIADIAQSLDVKFESEGETTKVILAGQDVSQAIRTEAMGLAASKVAAHPMVRAALLQRQRDFCKAPGLVADGRDMGTVVFPNAPVKIFLTASAQERARRRVLQIESSGGHADFDKVLKDIQKRDEQDSTRSSAPLLPAEDALMLDSTALSISQVVDAVMSQIEKKIADD